MHRIYLASKYFDIKNYVDGSCSSIRGGVGSINQKSVCRKTRLNSDASKNKRGGDTCQLKKLNIFEKEE